ncbi:MAG: DUF2065 family protein [Candidatus Omnitrophica bacterium]|nr:DUF2065 family protein [Candidatus Omnitrophota bacterium]
MEATVLIAKILGPLYVVVGLGILVNPKTYQKIMGDFFENTALLYIGGLMAFLFGVIIIIFHNEWAVNLSLIITILGWLALIKGIVLLVFPSAMKRIAAIYGKSATSIRVAGFIALVLGAVLSYMGYFV